MHTPQYVLSLSEIEIWSDAQGTSSIVVPDPVDPTPKFDIVLSSPSTFRENGNIEVLCTVNNITATYGIVAVDFVVSYNKSAFTPVYPTGDDLTANYIKSAPKNGSSFLWEDVGTYCDVNAGKVYMRFAHKSAENGDGTRNDGELVFKIAFKAKASIGTYDFEATACRGTDPGSSNYKKLTEVYANGSKCSSTAIAISSSLVPTANGVTVSDGYIFGIAPNKTSAEIAAMFKGNVTVTSNGISKTSATGYIVTDENGGSAIIVVLGDVDGSGKIDTTDYLLVKKSFLGMETLNGANFVAADTDKSGKVDTTDYLQIKKHFLGQLSLY